MPKHFEAPATSGDPLSIAIVGSGISGLGAAWLLSKHHRVTLFEADDRLGGHTNTVIVETHRGPIPVDTGFIVFNAPNYPNLTALFAHLDVPTRSTTMSFSVSLDGGRFEYSGSGLAGLLAQRTNALKPRLWRLVRDILRFYREAPRVLVDDPRGHETLAGYLGRNGYEQSFVYDHLLPMAAAIWSAPTAAMLEFPVTSFVRFCCNHGLLQIWNRPTWRTVVGGSRTYIERIVEDTDLDVRLSNPIVKIQRSLNGVQLIDDKGTTRRFDRVIIATHADQALSMLVDPSPEEQRILGAFRYQRNRAVLHSDASLMPRRRRAWAAWNYRRHGENPEAPVSVTYWMNALQHLGDVPPLFVTLNPEREPAAKTVRYQTWYDHPLFDSAALSAQGELGRLQGRRNTWFCGSYCGYGFHEDGLQAGLAVAEDAGGVQRPWAMTNRSARIAFGEGSLMSEAAE
ncbi:MAG: FAD-dependent oxidoreductase [Alphaproteobacteria bacterium]|nr:MAG: FAD-dependent oxidoreductase [Alphaproteobacteria bacterium]